VLIRPLRGLLAVGVSSLLAFAGLTLFVVGGWAALARFDTRTHDAVMAFGHLHPVWVDAMTVVTHFGDTLTLVLIDAALVVFCLARGRCGLAALVVAVATGGWLMRIGVRDLVARPRPPTAFWTEALASYPSGHTTNATLTVGLALLVGWPLLGRRGRIIAATAAAIYAFAVGFSRVAGGVHWPSDVVGGWLLGVGIVATVAGLRPERKSP
jgi:undecaprenyl-diphosphatase